MFFPYEYEVCFTGYMFRYVFTCVSAYVFLQLVKVSCLRTCFFLCCFRTCFLHMFFLASAMFFYDLFICFHISRMFFYYLVSRICLFNICFFLLWLYAFFLITVVWVSFFAFHFSHVCFFASQFCVCYTGTRLSSDVLCACFSHRQDPTWHIDRYLIVCSYQYYVLHIHLIKVPTFSILGLQYIWFH